MAQKHIIIDKNRLLSPWTMGACALFYLALLALLIFLPGGSLLDHLRWLVSGICAQMPTHSFYPAGERLPLCARNTGIYLGFMVTLLTLYASGRGRVQRLPTKSITIALGCGIAALGIDGLNSLALDLGLPHLYQPSNLLRLATGLATGLALAAFTLPLLNRLFWCEFNERRSFASWGDMLRFLPVLAFCFIAVSTQSAPGLYPIALLSTTGVLMALSCVNLICLVAVSKRDESFASYRELLPFFSVAFLLAIGELLLLAQLKFSILHAFGL
ncbi:MAG: DUF2085 domain-containing protein [Chloroflexota bacterium]|nr:DUF2085 domain-containing protein [Chloroflexota bacterium]